MKYLCCKGKLYKYTQKTSDQVNVTKTISSVLPKIRKFRLINLLPCDREIWAEISSWSWWIINIIKVLMPLKGQRIYPFISLWLHPLCLITKVCENRCLSDGPTSFMPQTFCGQYHEDLGSQGLKVVPTKLSLALV